MKVLVTGATGFLGKSIKKNLEENYTLFCLSRTNGDYKVFLENQIPMFDQQFDIVIHAAGKAHEVPNNDERRADFYNVNVVGTKNLLRGLEKKRVPKYFVFISSVSVYGLDVGINIKEDNPLNAKDAYGLSKIEAEKLISDWCHKNNVIYTILRLPLLVGKNPPGNLGKMIKGIKKGYYFNIAGTNAKKSMVLADNVASFIPTALLLGGTYNLTDGFHPGFEELSVALSKQLKMKTPFKLPFQIAKLLGNIGDLIGSKSPINSSKLKKMTSDLTFDDTKARELLLWKPQSVLYYLKYNKI